MDEAGARSIRNNAGGFCACPKTNVQEQPAVIKGYQNDKSYSRLRSRLDRGANSSPSISHIESVKRSTPPKTISPLIDDKDEKNGLITRAARIDGLAFERLMNSPRPRLSIQIDFRRISIWQTTGLPRGQKGIFYSGIVNLRWNVRNAA